MYTPPAFREDRLDVLHDVIRGVGLAIMISRQSSGGNIATHVPLLLAADEGPYGTLHGHLARANTHWSDLDATTETLAIFPGPESYVTPSYYATKRETGKVVPTWNYVAVHAYGTLDIYDDATRLHALVARLTNHHEAGRAERWSVDDAPPEFTASQLRGIVGFALPIARLEGKRKLSQNRPEADREGVRAGLAADGRADAALLVDNPAR